MELSRQLQPMVSDVIPLAPAFPANAMSFRGDIGIGLSVGMILRAVGFLSKVATAHVLRMGDRFQVSRIAAGPVSAGVIEFKALGNSADEVLINQPICSANLLPPSTLAITTWIDETNPVPAVSRLSIWDVLIQQFNDRLGSWHLGNSHFPDCRAGECLPHSSAHSFNHEEAV